jgi:hypothetical protein
MRPRGRNIPASALSTRLRKVTCQALAPRRHSGQAIQIEAMHVSILGRENLLLNDKKVEEGQVGISIHIQIDHVLVMSNGFTDVRP